MKSIAVVNAPLEPSKALYEDLGRTADYARAEKSAATQNAYWSEFEHF